MDDLYFVGVMNRIHTVRLKLHSMSTWGRTCSQRNFKPIEVNQEVLDDWDPLDCFNFRSRRLTSLSGTRTTVTCGG